MISPAFREKLEPHLKLLTDKQQEELIDFVSTLGEAKKKVIGVPGHTLLKYVGLFPPEDLAEIKAAVEEDCGRIDHDGW